MAKEVHDIDKELISNLNKQEKSNLDFINSCLYSKNDRINNASYHTMQLLLRLNDNPMEFLPEELNHELESIHSNLNKEEKIIIDKFILACVSSMDFFSNNKMNILKRERK